MSMMGDLVTAHALLRVSLASILMSPRPALRLVQKQYKFLLVLFRDWWWWWPDVGASAPMHRPGERRLAKTAVTDCHAAAAHHWLGVTIRFTRCSLGAPSRGCK